MEIISTRWSIISVSHISSNSLFYIRTCTSHSYILAIELVVQTLLYVSNYNGCVMIAVSCNLYYKCKPSNISTRDTRDTTFYYTTINCYCVLLQYQSTTVHLSFWCLLHQLPLKIFRQPPLCQLTFTTIFQLTFHQSTIWQWTLSFYLS